MHRTSPTGPALETPSPAGRPIFLARIATGSRPTATFPIERNLHLGGGTWTLLSTHVLFLISSRVGSYGSFFRLPLPRAFQVQRQWTLLMCRLGLDCKSGIELCGSCRDAVARGSHKALRGTVCAHIPISDYLPLRMSTEQAPGKGAARSEERRRVSSIRRCRPSLWL